MTPEEPKPLIRTPSYSWVLALVAVALIVYVTVNSLSTEGQGGGGLEIGDELPPAAMPLALSDLDGDANIAKDDDGGEAGNVPACSVRGPDVVNLCELGKGQLVLVFYASRGGNCERELDRVERVRTRVPGVTFAAVAIRGDRSDLRDEIRERGWRFPIGFDRDGAVANLYRIAGCPTIVLAKDGFACDTLIGTKSEAELIRAARTLKRKASCDDDRP